MPSVDAVGLLIDRSIAADAPANSSVPLLLMLLLLLLIDALLLLMLLADSEL